MDIQEGALIPPKGYRAVGLSCGIYGGGTKDIALIASDRPASAAGVFTTNIVQAAPVHLNREHLSDGKAQAILVNSGNANACTGENGMANARHEADLVSRGLSLKPEDILVNSTGVIGVHLPMDTVEAGIASVLNGLGDGWDDASEAIMTTDTVPKRAAATIEIDGETVTVAGMAKGSGMIAPNMATMLCFVVTDAGVSPNDLKTSLLSSTRHSFNCVTVDGDMSTNDTILVLANDATETGALSGKNLDNFNEALEAVCISLARQVARDGEGATKLITIRVAGAPSEEASRTVGLSIANSSLVKTAVFGRDPNWGRILCAMGYAGVDFDPDNVTVSMAGLPIFADGAGLEYDHDQAVESLGAENIAIDIDLRSGPAQSVVYTCDLTYDYVRINAEYTT
ncbi:MAG: bifunctional glutamate N-acetyltransferase/amino-acid acetyltransferase ArgJ [Candidatus Latescibacterota bacterium]|nr:bifunctional glutamate N-acetyltransferase/amino-acid acetyltransferase ArgJ [Candidatus Latescibacterota bacterium]